MPISHGQYSSYGPGINLPGGRILHPFLLNFCGSHFRTAPIQWIWLSNGHGRPWPYAGGNFLPFYQGNQCSQSHSTLLLPCFPTVWATFQGNLWSGTTICLCLCLETHLTPPIQCSPLYCLPPSDQWGDQMSKSGSGNVQWLKQLSLLRGLRNQISSSTHSSVVWRHVEFQSLGSSTSGEKLMRLKPLLGVPRKRLDYWQMRHRTS